MFVRCPTCGKITQWEGNPYRPFCSRRCKEQDLYYWLSDDEEDSENSKKQQDSDDEN